MASKLIFKWVSDLVMSIKTYQQAITILDQVIFQGRSLGRLMEAVRRGDEPAYLQALCFGVLRHYWQLDEYLSTLLNKPLRDKEVDIFLLLIIGLFELNYMRKPDYAVVSELVKVPAKLKKTWAKGLVNAVMRNFLRKSKASELTNSLTEEGLFNHPDWFIRQLKQDYPESWQAILEANNQQAPMSLRVNQQQFSRDEYLEQLDAADLVAEASQFVLHGIVLKAACEVGRLPGFTGGSCFVQDIAAQLASELLPLQVKQHVLDACAAPGGKTTHLLEREPSINLVAIDNQAERVEKINQNLSRLQLTAQVQCADVLAVKEWWNGDLFDAILLDAPCSATGVIRRHPDIKHLRHPEDIGQLAKTQQAMLTTLWPLLKSGGYLLYVTCSVLKAENDEIIAAFLKESKECQVCEALLQERLSESVKKTVMRTPLGIQLLPQVEHDGFYFSLLKKA